MEDGIYTYFADMPTTIRSFVISNNDMSFTIILNARIASNQQLIAYKHEIDHIRNGDYDKKCSVDLIEFAAHQAQIAQ